MALLTNTLLGALVALLGLTGLNVLFLLHALHQRRLIGRAAMSLLAHGKRRGRQQALDEVRILAHGQLKAHIIAAQHCLTDALKVANSEVCANRLKQGLMQIEHLVCAVTRLHSDVDASATTTNVEQALRTIAANLSAAYPACECQVDAIGRPATVLAPSLQGALALVLYNALHNAYTHGKPSRIHVHLQYAPDAVILVVADNGYGFSPNANAAGGRGMRDMRHVTRQHNGALSVESRPGRGTRVTATFPFQWLSHHCNEGDFDVSLKTIRMHPIRPPINRSTQTAHFRRGQVRCDGHN